MVAGFDFTLNNIDSVNKFSTSLPNKKILKSFLLWLLIVAGFVETKAQVDSKPFLKLSSLNAGLQFWSPSEATTFEHLQLLAKNAGDFTPIDLSDYALGKFAINAKGEDGVPFILPNAPVNTSKFLSGTRFYLQAGFQPYSKKKKSHPASRELLIGLYYQQYVYHNANYLDLDTLRPDSLIGNYVYYTEWTPVLGLTGDYIFKTDPAKRVGAYFGMGAGIGTSVHPVILENYGTFSEVIRTDTFSNGVASYPYFKGLTDTKNTIAAVPSLMLELRFPFGGTLLLSKGWSLMANVEGKISKQIYFNGESFSSRFGIAATVGVRYRLDEAE